MIIDGKALAAEIIARVAGQAAVLPVPPHLTVFTCAPNFETQKFLALKQTQSAIAGIALTLHEFQPDVTLAEVSRAVTAATEVTDGIIIQFPFPPHLPITDLIPLIPATHDVDAFTYSGEGTAVLPPVVGAIDVIASAHGISFVGKNVVVVGNGRLVGVPAALYARAHGGVVTSITKDTANQAAITLAADILILGAGVPGLITADMVKPGVIIFDAGTSEEGGLLVGDANPDVASKAALLTPVPGGIGPLTIAILLKNVLSLAQEHRKNRAGVV